MFCMQCGHPNPNNSSSCEQCGLALVTSVSAWARWSWLLWPAIVGVLIIGMGLILVAAVFWLRPVIFEPIAIVRPTLDVRLDQNGERDSLPETPTPSSPAPTLEPMPTPVTTSLPTKTPVPRPTDAPSPTAIVISDPTTMPLAIEFLVPSTQARFHTGLHLSQGQIVTVEYLSGSWRAGPSPTWPLVGATGDPQVPSKATFPVPNVPVMTLIAGVGDAPPFPAYDRLTFTAAASGALWLGANDDNFGDNAGSLTVRVTVTAPQSVNLTATPTPLLTANVEAWRMTASPAGDVWAGFPVYLSGHRVYAHPNWDGREDIQAFWRLGWDDDYLYVMANVIDDVHVQTQTGNQIYRGDSLDMQIDTNLAASLDYLTPAVFQVVLSPGNFADIPPSAFRFQGNNQRQIRDAPGHAIVVTARQTETGYILEAAIPWRDLGVTPYAGLVLGLALNANDNDTPGTAMQEVMMSNAPGRWLTDPSTWGTLTLRP